MEELPDPTKKARELREELGRKIGELILDQFNRAGRGRIEAGINKLIDNYSLGIELQIDVDIKMNVAPMSGEDFVWHDLSPPSITFDGAH
ncbi:MAG: hypothetical protein WA021_01460 [Minisyncoccia bacterium]